MLPDKDAISSVFVPIHKKTALGVAYPWNCLFTKESPIFGVGAAGVSWNVTLSSYGVSFVGVGVVGVLVALPITITTVTASPKKTPLASDMRQLP